MVLCTAEVTTGLFFEKFYQKFGKVVDEYYMKYYRFHTKKHNCTINSKGETGKETLHLSHNCLFLLGFLKFYAEGLYEGGVAHFTRWLGSTDS